MLHDVICKMQYQLSAEGVDAIIIRFKLNTRVKDTQETNNIMGHTVLYIVNTFNEIVV